MGLAWGPIHPRFFCIWDPPNILYKAMFSTLPSTYSGVWYNILKDNCINVLQNLGISFDNTIHGPELVTCQHFISTLRTFVLQFINKNWRNCHNSLKLTRMKKLYKKRSYTKLLNPSLFVKELEYKCSESGDEILGNWENKSSKVWRK